MKLSNLRHLDIHCSHIADLQLLTHLNNLESLKLKVAYEGNLPFEILSLPKLKLLDIRNSRFLNIPPELTKGDNALPHLKNFYAELQKASYQAYDAKQIIVGNGRVGKTSLLKALYGLGDFDPEEDSTHGIQLFSAKLPLPGKHATANLHLWDFGGQELYHATHRLFLLLYPLCIVVWDPETEQQVGEEIVNLHGQDYIFRNYPLTYWLGNIRAMNREAKIIVVCNKVDDGKDYLPEQIKELQAEYNIHSFISVSTKTDYGIAELRHRIQYLLEQMPEMGMEMPISWLKVKEKLVKLREHQDFISIDEYRLICATVGLSPDAAGTLLYALDYSSFLMNLDDQIILNQKWALQAVYLLFDRNSWYPLLKGNALRKQKELIQCWKDYAPEQIDLFFLIMEVCELALKLDQQSDNPSYLIPEFLTDFPAPAIADIWEAQLAPIFYFRFQHHFFHAALIQRFIVRSAKLAERYDLLWRTGLLIKVKDTLVLIRVYPEQGRIEMQLRGSQTAKLLELLKNEISRIQKVGSKNHFFVSCTGHPDEWVNLSYLNEQIKKGKSQLVSTSNEILEAKPFYPLIGSKSLDEYSENDQPGLKELADQESGSQLLQPIEPSSPLQTLQNQVKDQLIAANLQAALTLLRNYLKPGTTATDDLIILQSQYTRYEQESQRGLLDTKEKDLKFNHLLISILNFLNSIPD